MTLTQLALKKNSQHNAVGDKRYWPADKTNPSAFGKYPFNNTIMKMLKIDHRILRNPRSSAIDNSISGDKAAGYQSKNNACAVDRSFTKSSKSIGQNGGRNHQHPSILYRVRLSGKNVNVLSDQNRRCSPGNRINFG